MEERNTRTHILITLFMDHHHVNAVCVEVDVFVLSCSKQLLLVVQQQSSVGALAHLWIFACPLKSVWWCRHSVYVFTQEMNAPDLADIQNAVHFWIDRVAVLLTSNIYGCRFIPHSVKLFGTTTLLDSHRLIFTQQISLLVLDVIVLWNTV